MQAALLYSGGSHFEELSNTECAATLGIEAKAASIRYIRALKRMKELMERGGV